MPSVERITGSPIVVKALETASQTYKAGDLVQFSGGSGRIIVGTANSFCAIARKDAQSPTTGNDVECEIELLNAVDLYRMIQTAALTAALAGDDFDITFTVGAHTIAVASGTPDGYIVALEDAVGTTSGRLLVRFDDAAIAAGILA